MNDEKEQTFQIDLMQKIITRTDGFHNYANTKSTIIITFITAIIAAVCANAPSAIKFLIDSNHADLAVGFKVLTFLIITALLIAFFFVGKTVMPYVKKSKNCNIYSFIDIVGYFNSEGEYRERFYTTSKEELLNSMSSLQFNLAQGLVAKYYNHRIAIFFIAGAVFFIFLALLTLLVV
jgi:hypothetical protein